MKTLNLLSKAELKNVMGGNTPEGSGPCNNWANSSDFGVCFNCCLAYEDTQPAPVDPTWNKYDACDQICSM